MNADIPTERKSSFDARKSYLDVMEKILSEEKIASLYGEPVAWSQSLLTLLGMCWAYVNKEERLKIKDELVTLQRRAMSLPRNNPAIAQYLSMNINNQLRDLEFRIHDMAASLMLPTSNDEEKGFDDKDFLGGSDL